MPTDHDIIIEKLTAAAQTGRCDGLTIEYWIGGGQPPPYYRSEQFRIKGLGDRIKIELATMRFQNRFTPPEVLEIYSVLSDGDELKQLATELLATQFHEAEFIEEADPQIGGVISHEISIHFEKHKLTKRYFRQLPAAFATFEELSKTLKKQLTKSGKRTWTHKGHEIANPFNDLDK